MKVPALFVFCTAASAAFGATVGETYEQLVAEKGKPKSQMVAGDVRLVTYPDAKIKLRGDVIFSVTPIAATAPTAIPTPSPTAAPLRSAADSSQDDAKRPVLDAKQDQQLVEADAGMKRAVEQVKRIVNQPVTPTAITPKMRVTPFPNGWFHEGALTPDFANVDVRKSQQFVYDQYEYVTSNLTPGVAFEGKHLEFNPMLKLFYTDRTLPKKKLNEREMLEINQLYRQIAKFRKFFQELQSTSGH